MDSPLFYAFSMLCVNLFEFVAFNLSVPKIYIIPNWLETIPALFILGRFCMKMAN